MFHRMIVSFCLLLSLAVLPLSSRAAESFTFADVQAMAQDLAGTAYVPATPVPEFLTSLSYDEWRSIRYLPEKALWSEDGLPFTVQFFHPGLYYDRTVRVHVVQGDTVEDVAFDPSLFQYGNEELAKQVTQTKNMNFAGLRLHYPLNRPDYRTNSPFSSALPISALWQRIPATASIPAVSRWTRPRPRAKNSRTSGSSG